MKTKQNLWLHVAVLAISVCYPLLGQSKHRPQVLDEVGERVEEAIENGKTPFVIFDIDDTLTNARSRTHRIIQEFIREREVVTAHPDAVSRLKKVRMNEVQYALADTMKAAGVNDEAFQKKLNDAWLVRFFSDAYCAHDIQISGASAYVRSLRDQGAHIVYLTGRDAPRMEKGTRANLKSRRFPLGEETVLMMKPNKELPDLDYKKEAFAQISKMGEIVAGFENEPANLNAMSDAFPSATMVFLDTAHSNKPDVPKPSIDWVKDYLY